MESNKGKTARPRKLEDVCVQVEFFELEGITKLCCEHPLKEQNKCPFLDKSLLVEGYTTLCCSKYTPNNIMNLYSKSIAKVYQNLGQIKSVK